MTPAERLIANKTDKHERFVDRRIEAKQRLIAIAVQVQIMQNSRLYDQCERAQLDIAERALAKVIHMLPDNLQGEF